MGIDGHDAQFFQGFGQELQRGFLTLFQAANVGGLLSVLDRQLEAVPYGQQLLGKLFQAIPVGGLDIFRGPLPDVVQVRDSPQLLLPMALGALFGLGQSLLQAL